MNRKGQALVEFVLILPVLLFLIFAVYDFGMIYTRRASLENNSSDIISMYREGMSINDISLLYPKLSISEDDSTDYHKITISDNVKIITPGLNRVLGNPYSIKVERYIPNE